MRASGRTETVNPEEGTRATTVRGVADRAILRLREDVPIVARLRQSKRFGRQDLPRNVDRFQEGAMNKISALVCFLALSTGASAATPLAVDAALRIPSVMFDSAGNLSIKASATSSANDFDFLVGHWKLTNKKLKCRLHGCTEWSAPFESFVDMEKVLGGAGNLDKYHEEVAGKR